MDRGALLAMTQGRSGIIGPNLQRQPTGFDVILYEHPFNERVRTYLRLEYLFRRFELLLQRDHPADHHFCSSTASATEGLPR